MADEVERVGVRKRVGAGAGEVVLTSYPALVVVEHAPDETMVSLELLAASGDLFVSRDMIYLGNERNGDEVAYRVTGWDPQQAALTLRRERS
jgi:hypothetical protein